jgi:hypothetical protein
MGYCSLINRSVVTPLGNALLIALLIDSRIKRSAVLTTLTMKIAFSWDVTPRCLECEWPVFIPENGGRMFLLRRMFFRHFERTFFLRNVEGRMFLRNVGKDMTLKEECSFEMSVKIWQTPHRHNPEILLSICSDASSLRTTPPPFFYSPVNITLFPAGGIFVVVAVEDVICTILKSAFFLQLSNYVKRKHNVM